MLTAKQHELLLFIQRKLEESGISPSFEEMKEALDLKSKSGVHRLISALEERGFIRRLPNRARALEVLRQPEDVAPARAVANANDTVTKITTPPRVAPAANDGSRFRSMAASLPACRSKRSKPTAPCRCRRPCSVPVSIMRSKSRATR